jgi:transcriptional regulator with XRE-family HTH domain
MIADSKIHEVVRLLVEGKLSFRQIAVLVGISRATISKIASGERPDYEALRRERNELLEPQGPPVRCSTCGGKVFAPCRLCRVRSIKQKEQQRLKMLRKTARRERALQLIEKVKEQQERDGQ